MSTHNKAASAIKDAVKKATVLEARGESDTIRLWENYRDQALLWRSLALLQIPTTLAAIIFSLVLWHTRKVTLNVPRDPLPGQYSVAQLPDEKFIEAATDYINLVASYTPATVRTQFAKASEMLKEPLLSKFRVEMIENEVRAIEQTNRTQIFFADPTRTQTKRNSPTEMLVQVDGMRMKIVGGQEIPPVATRFLLTLTTVPRNVINPYGIVITNVLIGVPQDEDVKK
jgi:hypothetical protein